MRKAIIGIPGSLAGSDNFGAGVNNLNFISTFGDARIIMPWEEDVDIDVLYLPGGRDVSPASYGETPGYSTGNSDVFKEAFFTAKLASYINRNIPIFAVCLGAQMLNVHFGGKLTQNLLFHEQSSGRWSTAHDVDINPNAVQPIKLMAKMPTKMKVNSHHHQAILATGLGESLRPIYTAANHEGHILRDSSDIIEAFISESNNVIGVQWHPEELYDAFSMKAMDYLCKLNKK